MKTLLGLLAFSCLLLACSPKTDNSPKTLLTASQKKALEQAKRTEQVLKDESERRLKEVERESTSEPDVKK